MAERPRDEPIAPRRTLKGPVLPPPPPELAEESRKAEEKDKAKQERAAAKSAARERRDAQRQADSRFRAEAEKRAAAGSDGSATSGRSGGSAAAAGAAGAASGAAASSSSSPSGSSRPSRGGARAERSPRGERRERSQRSGPATPAAGAGAGAAAAAGSASGGSRSQERPTRPATTKKAGTPRRTRRAQLRLVQVDAWSVMKTAFLLSIALGIVLVVAVAIIWSVLGAAGVWTNINSIVQQAVGGESGSQFDIRQYVGTSRILGFTMIVAAVDVILITAIATLGAFLYNLSAALLGGIEVTLAEDG